jgi:adenylate cyclase
VSGRKTDDGGTVAVYSDVTELKQREQELSLKTSGLEATRLELQADLATPSRPADRHDGNHARCHKML